jgi:putative sterol carrier protein
MNPDDIAAPEAPPADRLPPDLREAVERHRVEPTDGPPFTLVLERGRLRVETTAEGPADDVIRGTTDDVRRLLRGELNLMTAFMRGDVRFSGDLACAKRLYRWLRLARSGGSKDVA